eukprot:c1420_g1_i1.p1 GENE.c1420_g1_i1~~c1420_g1_i1.p1  ORF type:complete len:200 (-),score=33.56 c1420_g1_i1:52-618(-)
MSKVYLFLACFVAAAIAANLPLSLEAELNSIPLDTQQPLLKPDPEGIFCRYKNFSMYEPCVDGGECAIHNVTSASDLCEQIYLHDHVTELPFMTSNFTTPYLPAPGCPSVSVDHLHVPLQAFRTGNRYRSTICTLTCGKFCERISNHAIYHQGHMLRTMVPLCHCKYLVNQELKHQAAAQKNQTESSL